MLIIFWFCAYSSYFCYLKTIESYLGKELKGLAISKYFCLSFCLLQVICGLSDLIFDYSFLYNFHSEFRPNVFSHVMHFKVSPNLLGKTLGGLGALVVLYSSVVIWRALNKRTSAEKLLKIGIIVTVLVVLNDSALGLEITGAILPLYYFGNAFEAIRFNFHYGRMACEKMLNLEKDILRLSKVAHFGFAAASIAHDIKNHLFVIKVSVNNALKGLAGTDPLLVSLSNVDKHSDKISDITDLYMNIFKKNSSSEKCINKLSLVVKEACALLEKKYNDSSVQLVVELEDFEIECNQTEVSMCLVNLLKNSLEEVLHNSNHHKPWVKISSSSKERTIDIVDCGAGIKEEDVSHIFELGYSTKDESGGHGVGLAITRELLCRSGFKLHFLPNELNTTFRISF